MTADTFSGNGSQTAFTMSVSPASAASVLVVVSGVTQEPSTYTVSGTTLTFSAAPPSGTGNISVRYLGVPSATTVASFSGGTTGLTPATATTGAVTLAGILNVANGGTGQSSPGASGNVLTSNGTSWVSSPASGAVANGTMYENSLTISSNYTITTNKNAFSVGPITVNSGVVVTVPSGSRWLVM